MEGGNLIVTVLTKARHIERQGNFRISVKTKNIMQHPVVLARLLFSKTAVAPTSIDGTHKEAQIVLESSFIQGVSMEKSAIETFVLNWLVEVKSTLTEDEVLSTYTWPDEEPNLQEEHYVSTAYDDRSLVFSGKVTSVTLEIGVRRITIELTDGKEVWAELRDEHRLLYQRPPLWMMLAQHSDSIFHVPRPGDPVEVAIIENECYWRMLPRVMCWRLTKVYA